MAAPVVEDPFRHKASWRCELALMPTTPQPGDRQSLQQKVDGAAAAWNAQVTLTASRLDTSKDIIAELTERTQALTLEVNRLTDHLLTTCTASSATPLDQATLDGTIQKTIHVSAGVLHSYLARIQAIKTASHPFCQKPDASALKTARVALTAAYNCSARTCKAMQANVQAIRSVFSHVPNTTVSIPTTLAHVIHHLSIRADADSTPYAAARSQQARFTVIKLPDGSELLQKTATTPHGSDGIQQEQRVYYQLGRHPNILPFHGMSADDDILIACATRGDLSTAIKEMTLSTQEMVRIVRGLIAAIWHSHGQGVTHADIKPHNVMLSEHDDVWMADWGYAFIARDDGSYAGSLPYIPPEMCRRLEGDKTPLNLPAVDLWSLGALILTMVSYKTHLFKDQPTPFFDMLARGYPLESLDDRLALLHHWAYWDPTNTQHWIDGLIRELHFHGYVDDHVRDLVCIASLCLRVRPKERPTIKELQQEAEHILSMV